MNIKKTDMGSMTTSKHVWSSARNEGAYERTKANQERYGRPFDIETDGAHLAKYLNLADTQPGMRALVEPLEKIVLQLRALSEEVVQNWAAVKPRATFSVAAHEESEEKLRQFNSLLEPHTWQIRLVGFNEKNGRAVPVFVELPTLGTEANLMFRLVQLARAGRLHLLRRCAWCGIWFFARKRWAECHDKACSRARIRSMPEFKEKNREFQRKYYRNTLSPYQRHYGKGLSPAEVRNLLRTKERKTNGKKR
jgi:hypothetical protein